MRTAERHPGDWPSGEPPRGTSDLYFFAHGNDYRGALRDFISVAGRTPLLPMTENLLLLLLPLPSLKATSPKTFRCQILNALKSSEP
eukprot:gene12907-biopygen8195